MAPGATLSGCRIIGDDADLLTPERAGGSFLYANMENMDVSSNSWGPVPCERLSRLRRRLQATCPFLPEAPPCQTDSACSGVDWGFPRNTPSECQDEIVAYCTNAFNFETDLAGCTEFLDLFAQCEYITSENEQLSIRQGVEEGRDGKGIVYVFAAGNDFGRGEDTNQYGNTHNTRLVINVGAVGKDGVVSTYSARGTGLFVVGPGGDSESWSNHVVALNGGGCKDAGQGTSYATPAVSGVIALILEANGNLTYRDVQGIVATTSQRVNPDDSSWVVNAAGIAHSDEYGFGLIDAGVAVAAAQTWQLYATEQMVVARSGNITLDIPEYTPESDPLTSSVTMVASDSFSIEGVYLYIKLTHSTRGDLQITLTSPSGTQSIVHPWGRPENGNSDGFWKFTTWKNYGEDASGEWTLSIEDRKAGDYKDCFDNNDYLALFTFTDGSSELLSCEILDSLDFCQTGGTELFGVNLTGPNDPSLVGIDGQTPAEACCSCNGGIPASSIPDVLEEWYVVAYGHEVQGSPAPTTSVPATLAPSSPAPTTSVPATLAPSSSAPTTVPTVSNVTQPSETIAPTGSPSGTNTTFGMETELPTANPTEAPTTSPNATIDTMIPVTDSPTSSPSVAPSTDSPASVSGATAVSVAILVSLLGWIGLAAVIL